MDTEVERRARAEVMRVAKQIEEKVRPHHPELSMFSAPKDLPLRWPSSLFHIEYNPRLYSLVTPLTLNRDNLPWIHIRCGFQSKDLAPGAAWAKKEIPTPPAELDKQKKTVYFMFLEGTDILIEALAASNDERLIKDLRTALKGRENTQQDAAADPDKPRR